VEATSSPAGFYEGFLHFFAALLLKIPFHMLAGLPSRSNWNIEMITVFQEKKEYLEKNHSTQRKILAER